MAQLLCGFGEGRELRVNCENSYLEWNKNPEIKEIIHQQKYVSLYTKYFKSWSKNF